MITLATTVFELVGKIAVNISEATSAIDETVKKAEEAETPFKTAMDKLGTIAKYAGAAIAAGVGVASAALGNLLKESLNISGQVEQGIGGAEAIFGDYAASIHEHAKEAYASMGVSIADYYKTANKMGSLFKGTGADAEDTFEMTVNAMQRASDVAALMGIDINWAMESVAGMTKGNFTMMDNLGVAMTETTLKNYALGKGIQKTWEQMSKGEQIAIAYEMFMERTSYAMGQYTKENDTYAGSLNTVKAAWKNFLAGEMSIEEVLPHFESAGQVMIDRITKLLPHLVTGLTALMSALIPYIDNVVDALVPVVIPALGALFTAFIESLPALIKASAGALNVVFRELMNAIFSPAASIEVAEWSAPTPEDPLLNEAVKNNKTDDPFGTKDYWGFVTDEPIPEGAGVRNYLNDSIDFLENYDTNIGIPAAGIGIGDLPSVVAALKSAVDTLSANVQNITVQGSVRLDSGALVGSLLPGINVGLGRMVNRGNYG